MSDETKNDKQKPGDDRDHGVRVHFKSFKTGEKVNFKINESVTLEDAWKVANTKLEESREPGDTLRCAGGDDIMSHLQKSIEKIREDKICTNLHFEIKGDSGGANA